MNWFRADEFASVTGLTAGIAGLGSLLATTPLAVVIGLFGWRATLFWLAVVGLGVAATVYALVWRSPADRGFDPIQNLPTQPTATVGETLRYIRELAADRE